MLGEGRTALDLNERGVVGDRLYAVRDGASKFGSGKTTRRFRRMDGLIALRAYRGAIAVVAFPDGSKLRGDDPALAARLSDLIGFPSPSLVRTRFPTLTQAPSTCSRRRRYAR